MTREQARKNIAFRRLIARHSPARHLRMLAAKKAADRRAAKRAETQKAVEPPAPVPAPEPQAPPAPQDIQSKFQAAWKAWDAARFPRNESKDKKWVKCQEGWISYTPVGVENYYVTATGHKAMTIHGSELHEVLRELIEELGGRA